MKKTLTFLMLLLVVNANLFAGSYQQQIELQYEREPKHDKSPGRSLQMDIEAFLDIPYLVFCSYMTNEQEADICILNARGGVVMSETLRFSPYSETPLYIGDLPYGEYQLVIELEDAALYGTFLIL